MIILEHTPRLLKAQTSKQKKHKLQIVNNGERAEFGNISY